MTNNIKNAIEESLNTDRTVHVPYEEWTADDNRALDAESVSMQVTNKGFQYWGHDAKGREWTVVLASEIVPEEES